MNRTAKQRRIHGTGSIVKRGDRYAVVLDLGLDENGKRRRKWLSGFESKKDAGKACREAVTRLEQAARPPTPA